MSKENINQKLLKFFTSEYPNWKNIVIKNLTLQSFEKTNILSDIYFFDLNVNENSSNKQYKLVLKLGLGDDKSTELIWSSEKQVMSKLYDCRYPVPRIFGYGETLISDRGAFIVMERIQGQMLSDVINETQNNLPLIDNYFNSYASLMVKLHNLKVEDETIAIGRKNEMFTSGHLNPTAIYLEDYLKFTKHIKYDTLSRIIEWLINESKNLEVPLELGITHGDYQTDNVIVVENKELCIIDWGFARTADIRMDVHWTRLLNRIMHNEEISDYIYNNYLQIQDRNLTDRTFFMIVAMVRLLIGLSQLANRSENYHDNVNRFIKNMDMNFIKKSIADYTKLDLPDLESDFRSVTGVKK